MNKQEQAKEEQVEEANIIEGDARERVAPEGHPIPGLDPEFVEESRKENLRNIEEAEDTSWEESTTAGKLGISLERDAEITALCRLIHDKCNAHHEAIQYIADTDSLTLKEKLYTVQLFTRALTAMQQRDPLAALQQMLGGQ